MICPFILLFGLSSPFLPPFLSDLSFPLPFCCVIGCVYLDRPPFFYGFSVKFLLQNLWLYPIGCRSNAACIPRKKRIYRRFCKTASNSSVYTYTGCLLGLPPQTRLTSGQVGPKLAARCALFCHAANALYPCFSACL